MILYWTKEKPSVEGWYFWKKSKTTKDPWKFSTIFYISRDNTYWETGTLIIPPKGGWWSLIS